MGRWDMKQETQFHGQFRGRRLRATATLRGMVRETRLAPTDFIYPLFITEGVGVRNEIASMPDVYQLSVDEAVRETARAADAGVPAVILFGLPASKDETGSSAWDPKAPVQRAVAAIKKELPHVLVITDVCLCEYTSHGHCGILAGDTVDNDKTLPLLARTAISHVEAGADIVAPSDMMDFRVGVIRRALDERGFERIPILAYSAKFASAFYGPFREAAESAPAFGDRRSYQMDPANAREALREIDQDVAENADMIMVKPALAYLDILRAARERMDLPLVAYNVSGEYAMVKAAARAGWIDETATMMEILTGIKRAGADLIITYHAVEAARVLASGA
jgi:porphobilinogen synthase